jgi:hypothetical protein
MGFYPRNRSGFSLMLSIEIQIKRFQLTARAHARLMREINRRTMERQRDERLFKHFENVAYAEYQAKARGSKYNQWKLRSKRIGHTRPNVKTGRLRRAVLKNCKITATQYGSKLTTHGTVKSRLANWQKREIAKLSKAEIRQERKRQASEYRRGALSPEYRRTRQRRIK